MWIWALFAGLTAVAVLFVLAPLARGGADASEDGDLGVYRDQLAEVDRDREAGLMADDEAEAARAEISRRLLRAARRAETAAAAPRRRSRLVAAAAVVLVPLASIGGYLAIGRPDLPDLPLTERLAAKSGDQSIETLVARVEAHLAAKPDDARGWEVIAPVYVRLGRFQDAARAWRTAIRLDGSNERRQIGLGETLVAANDGAIGADAQAAFRDALKVAPQSVLPRMYLAAALGQEDKKAEAVDAWKAIVASGTEADPWMGVAREELAKAEAIAAGKPVVPLAEPDAAKAEPGPTAAEMEAARSMSADDRSKMVAEMVNRLDERLKAGGGTIQEWERLIRAYRVMGRTAEADAAIGRARTALAGDAAALARIDALAAEK
ncbi:MAG: c-type cytochrome biogenesis protein CcmI [Hyphomicrobiales bacterium]|nr:c-type cytochrome biogenesis protein CcmI [Hyphomicrobiales bacterium]